jgi:2-polyprenyl-3-methyl-5-hydroxy-6-metoxy-1,4-benzoquinol methylase
VDRSAYDRYLEIEERHFWRIGKRRLVKELVAERFGERTDLRILDVGGAASLVAQDLRPFGEVECVEPDAATAALARSRHGIVVHERRLPDGLGDLRPAQVVTLLDVVEHIDDDLAAMRAIRELVTPDGIVIVTVPALSWLWSDHDVVLQHKRRYVKAELRSLLEAAGFHVERLSYYTSLLLPLVAASRVKLRPRPVGAPLTYDVKVPKEPVNRALGAVMGLERALLRRGDLPIGSALFAVASRGAARS